MPDSSLIPETPLTFSPGLAATIGLEEAILLQYLHGLQQHRAVQRRGRFDWLEVDRGHLLHQLPFWSSAQLQQICQSLVDKGVLLVDAHAPRGLLVYALNEERAGTPVIAAQPTPAATPAVTPSPTPPPTPSPSRAPTPAPAQTPAANAVPGPAIRAGLLPASWSPSEDMLQLLALNHNIPRGFALAQLEDFILYWRERGETSHAWDNKFRQHVLSQWRRSQQREAERFRADAEMPLDNRWRPNADAMEILLRAGVEQAFIEEAIPEFVLYWRERGSPPKELNSRFVQHIRLQWARYSASLQHSTEPQRISADWRPSEDVFDILRLSHIDRQFALALLPEFIVYWRDSNQLHTSWNSKFLQHVKYHWARQNNFGRQGDTHEGQQGTGGTGRTRDRSLEQDLSDTSWAN